MAGQASEYHRGEMDIHAQQATFHRGHDRRPNGPRLAIAAGVLFLTLWFCTAAGFFTAFISAVVLLAVGIFALRERGRACALAADVAKAGSVVLSADPTKASAREIRRV